MEVEDQGNDSARLSTSRKMRRSYSTSDMNKFLLSTGVAEVSHVDDEHASLICGASVVDSATNSTMILPPKQIDEMLHLNVTYDKTSAISPSKVVNSSFMDCSSILTQPLSVSVNLTYPL